MRHFLLLLGLIGLAGPAWADECQDRLAQAIADKDGARIEAFLGPNTTLTRRFFLAWRDRLEQDFAAAVVHRQQLKAIEEIEQGARNLGSADLKVFELLKRRITSWVKIYESEARFDAEALENAVAAVCVAFAEREQAARQPRPRSGESAGGQASEDRRPPKERYGTSAVLQMDGEPIPQPKVGSFKTVDAGKIEAVDPNYTITATWDELPQTLGPEGKTITLKITANGNNINTGIQIRGHSVEVRRKDGKPEEWGPEPLDLPVTSHGKEVTKTMTVHIMPGKLYAKDAKATVSIGVFYGRKVDYPYKVLNTGE